MNLTFLPGSIITQPSGCRGDWQQAADTQPDVTENGFILSGVTLICFSVLPIEGTDKDDSSVYMFILLPPQSEPYPNTLRLTFWCSNKTVSSSFLGLPVKYPLSQGSSSGCLLRCHFSHCQLVSHSLFFIVSGLFVDLCRASTNQSDLLTKASGSIKPNLHTGIRTVS